MSIEIVEEKFQKYADLKVVGASDVERWTMTGWKILAVMTDQMISSQSISMPVPTGGSWCTGSGSVPVVETVLKFLMGQDKESLVVELRTQNAKLVEETNKYATSMTQLHRKVTSLEADVNNSTHARELQAKETRELREKALKMENDLGKLRAALGTKQFDELLAPKAVS